MITSRMHRRKRERITSLLKRMNFLKTRIAEATANGRDLSWDKSEVLSLDWAIDHILRCLAQPSHNHDCEKCVYRGSCLLEGKAVDWWFCQGEGGGSIIGRYGEEGDYWSAPTAVVTKHPDMSEFFKAASTVLKEMEAECLVSSPA